MKPNRNYPLLLASQFLGAFGDNVILWFILGPLTRKIHEGLLTQADLSRANSIYTSLLFIPFVLLAPVAGFLNDRFPKTNWLLGGNLIKLVGTLLAMLNIWSVPAWQGIGYFVVGIGACVYSPAKYGILPEILPVERLVKANGTVEMLTLVAILLGTVCGAALVDKLPLGTCYGVLIGIYAVSLGLNLFMSKTPCDTRIRLQNSTREFFANFGALLRSARLARILLGTVLFWICGAIMKMNFQPWGIQTLGIENNTAISLLGVKLAAGIMIGSILAGQLHAVGDLRRTQIYGGMLACLILLLGLITRMTPAWQATVILVAAGAAAGLFLIPLNAALQSESDRSKLGKTIATQNFLENLAMCFGGALVFTASSIQLTAPSIFKALAALVGMAVVCLKIPKRVKPAIAVD
jgi:LPLT family lysophospholipid transporter-like MFS transporter